MVCRQYVEKVKKNNKIQLKKAEKTYIISNNDLLCEKCLVMSKNKSNEPKEGEL